MCEVGPEGGVRTHMPCSATHSSGRDSLLALVVLLFSARLVRSRAAEPREPKKAVNPATCIILYSGSLSHSSSIFLNQRVLGSLGKPHL